MAVKNILFCVLALCVFSRTLAENYAPSDGYEKCKVDNDCKAETCPDGQVSLCQTDMEECMCTAVGGGACDFINCQNEGLCINDGQDFRCHCMPGFTGPFCQHDKCDDVACNNGQCTHDVTSSEGVTCECEDGWAGERCDRPGVCRFVSCQQGAPCEEAPQNGLGFNCLCSPYYVGPFCERTLCDDLPCDHGDCLPIANHTAVTCKCDDGWTGAACDQEDTPAACTVNGDCSQDCGDGQMPFCSVPTFTCQCKTMSALTCATHHHCSEACDGTLGLCMGNGLCSCFHGLSNYLAKMIINRFPNSPPFIGGSGQQLSDPDYTYH